MKLWKLTLVAALVLVAVLALASCGCEHVYDEAITIKPTCTAEGEKTFTCSLCGEVYTEPVAATGHTYTDEVVAPTCTEEGYTLHTCACGDTYKDNTVAALGHENTSVVTAPTCSAEGYTTYTCGICGNVETGDVTAKDPGAHVWGTVIAELTAEQAAANPDAIGVTVEGCTVCGAKNENSTAEQKAVLINLDFETAPDIATYKGSDMYTTAYNAAVDKGKGDDVLGLLAYLDSQTHLDVFNASSYGGAIADGKMVVDNVLYYAVPFRLAYQTPAYPAFTIMFDLVINKDPAGYSNAKNPDALPMFFSLHDEKLYNNKSFALALNRADVDTDFTDDVHIYELYVESYSNNSTHAVLSQPTGYYITIGKEYSYKLDFTTTDGVYMVNVSIKETGAAEYTSVGSFEYKPYTQNRESVIGFSQGKAMAQGNVYDNFKLLVDLAK